jgi:transcriptional regulator with XRE-family HTH domain
MPVFEGLGKALRWLRAKQDRRQYQVAEDAGITKAMLSAYETGKQKPSLETLDKILDALGCDLADLHDALLVVNDRRGGDPAAHRLHPLEAERSGAPDDGAGIDVYRVLGIDKPLPPEEERAFAEMLGGFHRLIRFMHRSLEHSAGGPRSS